MIRPVLLAMLFVALAPAAVPYVQSSMTPPVPDREFRGAWVASVNNIDWPSRPGLPTAQQQQELLHILDRCEQLKLNVVAFQVRPACDALYSSAYEPWSEYLTGTQGKAPSPFWDPLAVAVTQAHARGLELHAWINPFRARFSGERSTPAANHVRNTQPGLVKAYGKFLWLDPGFPATHEHSIRVILDIVQRYDVDGIHIDDYFYPYPEKDSAKKDMPFPDAGSWQNYQRTGGKLSRDDWRRDNVNRFVARMYREVKAAKPWVKVGISPFGIYRPGFPAQIKGFDQFEALYADPRAWLASGSLDYLAPQLYWPIDQPAQSFPVLLKWWAENNPQRRMIVAGMNTSAVGTRGKENGWSANEIERQIQLTRRQPGISGHMHWNMSALVKNKGGIDNALLRGSYGQFALVPSLRTSGAPPPRRHWRHASPGRELSLNAASILPWTLAFSWSRSARTMARGKPGSRPRTHSRWNKILRPRRSRFAPSTNSAISANPWCSNGLRNKFPIVSKETRIDKWLWAVRLYKTRTVAATACKNGQVLIEGQRIKPSRDVRPGEVIAAKTGSIQRTVKVIAFPASRVGAKLVSEFLEDLTPQSEYEKAREFKPPPQFAWSKGVGRPTKKSRRLWEKFDGNDP